MRDDLVHISQVLKSTRGGWKGGLLLPQEDIAYSGPAPRCEKNVKVYLRMYGLAQVYCNVYGRL